MRLPLLFLLHSLILRPSDGRANPANETNLSASQRKLQEDDDAFTIIFLSDLENRYRGHTFQRCSYVLEYIRDLRNEQLFFGGDHSSVQIDPQLVIHGGDNNHMLGCENGEALLCRTVSQEWNDVWRTTFLGNLPLISGFGNHDWQTAKGTGATSSTMWGNPDAPRSLATDRINSRAQALVAKTYQESAALGVDFREFSPPLGAIGPSMYRSMFRGIQIASFNCATNWESYDSDNSYPSDPILQELSNSLDRSKTTLFFQHFPIFNIPQPYRDQTVSLIQQFPNAAAFAGHLHVAATSTYSASSESDAEGHSFTEYVAPYPHGDNAGVYALLVSPTQGILQVQPVAIPGLADGTPCSALSTCRMCSHRATY